MARVIQAPNEFPISFEYITIFLGGTIDMGNSEDWQAKVVKYFNHYDDVLLLNPRRDFYNANIEEQVMWERRAQKVAVFKIYNFEPASMSPITLLELGEYGEARNTFVRCNANYYRYDNVRIFCREHNIKMFDTLRPLCEAIDDKIAYNRNPGLNNV